MNINNIGSTNNIALLCHTNHPKLSKSYHSGGDWYAPDGTRVGDNDVRGFERNRGDMVVRLIKRTGIPLRGIYYCIIDDNSNISQRVFVGLYQSGAGIYMRYWLRYCLSRIICFSLSIGNVTIIPGGITFNSSQFILTCISTGGPATTVTWTRNSTTVTEGTETVLDDLVTARYTHTLTVTTPGVYTCIVANNKPSFDSASITVQGILMDLTNKIVMPS